MSQRRTGLVIPAMENIFSKCKDDSFDMNRISLNNGLQQGDYFIGPKVNFCSHPVKEITECIAKQEGSDECVVFKIVHCVSGEERDHNSQGKVLLHNEHLILSLLQDKQGVIHHRGLFKYLDKYILVLDCVMSHEHDKKGLYKDFINLQQYVIQKKQLQWIEALEVFCSMMTTLKMLHQNNIVHRDLKLGNMVYNTKGRYVTLINFSLSKHLIREDELLTDQCGSLAYVSPEVLSGNPYDGKASDMWAMGVILFTMVCGQFPFYDNDRQELFKKIRSADFVIPSLSQGGYDEIFNLITLLIEKDSQRRLSAPQTLEVAQQLLAQLSDEHPVARTQTCDSQVVPDSGDEAVLTDCVVPISKLSLEAHSGDFHSPPLGSWFLNSEVSVVLPDYQCATNSVISEPSYHMLHSHPNRTSLPRYTSCYHHPGDMSVTCTALQLRENEFPSYSRRIDTSTAVRPVSDDGYANFTRHAVSTEHLSVLVTPNMAETQRMRRNSSGSESRGRRHSTASYRISSQMQRHRRRSHDVRDEQVDLLERLHVAATRRRSLSSPFQTSPRSQGSFRPSNYRV